LCCVNVSIPYMLRVCCKVGDAIAVSSWILQYLAMLFFISESRVYEVKVLPFRLKLYVHIVDTPSPDPLGCDVA